jgi:hypothetical protein
MGLFWQLKCGKRRSAAAPADAAAQIAGRAGFRQVLAGNQATAAPRLDLDVTKP